MHAREASRHAADSEQFARRVHRKQLRARHALVLGSGKDIREQALLDEAIDDPLEHIRRQLRNAQLSAEDTAASKRTLVE